MTTLSLIVPTYNRAQSLSYLLDSLTLLESVALSWEVIVIDNASSDLTSEVVAQKAATLPFDIRYVYEAKPGLHQGRHRGAREARGDILAYLDDDVLLTPTWLHGSFLIRNGNADIVAGRVLPRWETHPPDWLFSVFRNGICSYLSLLDIGDEIKEISPDHVFGCNFFIRKALVFSAGGFHPDSVPPDRICFRGDGETGLMAILHNLGHKFAYDPNATVYHVISGDRLTIEYICKRAYNQGISDSFSQLRAKYGLPGYTFPTLKKRLKNNLRKPPIDIFKAALHRIGALVSQKDDSFAETLHQISESYRAGWEYHQQEFDANLELRNYVLQATYLE